MAQRILVVDDAGLVRRYYRDILSGAGYELAEAMNGIEGLERLLEQTADLVIVDINMPRMDGLTFVRTLRSQDSAIAGIATLVISTESGEQDRAAARAAGANFYLVKPVDRDVLLEHVGLMCGPPHG
ncbi:two-component system chemotaxis response regulator CheY [Stella humosa]|uniref:Two-component system chemotaxis response regulator CheY n=1 Tax=Stella humosa TaxID=94 RepID=A0A3N1KK31_9PROT|nr:response regulator [Stella humosa]ROP80794.1 two-component system chemotaxis response regulator CheY [Stella humosa]